MKEILHCSLQSMHGRKQRYRYSNNSSVQNNFYYFKFSTTAQEKTRAIGPGPPWKFIGTIPLALSIASYSYQREVGPETFPSSNEEIWQLQDIH